MASASLGSIDICEFVSLFCAGEGTNTTDISMFRSGGGICPRTPVCGALDHATGMDIPRTYPLSNNHFRRLKDLGSLSLLGVGGSYYRSGIFLLIASL
jgi:hypothetical protein